MSDLFEKIKLDSVKHIIVVASGKGGVGKSTVSANLAIALARNGYKTALMDADIFGPSLPRMFGLENVQPQTTEVDGKPYILPLEKFGVKLLSVGFFVEAGKGLVWRGPMAAKTLTQLFEETHWGEIDYLIVDFPPGTSDIQLTTAQKINVDGAIVVTTPQGIALSDARKAASMFMQKGIEIQIAGVVENMSWFSPEKRPEEKYHIFGKDGGKTLAHELGVPLLAQIPLVMDVGETAELGQPVYARNNKAIIQAFDSLAASIAEKWPADSENTDA